MTRSPRCILHVDMQTETLFTELISGKHQPRETERKHIQLLLLLFLLFFFFFFKEALISKLKKKKKKKRRRGYGGSPSSARRSEATEETINKK